jgi:hypothetical protein
MRSVGVVCSFDIGWQAIRVPVPSWMDDNPITWMVTVNGLIMDARSLPRPLQEEAYRKGLIPYIPGEKD